MKLPKDEYQWCNLAIILCLIGFVFTFWFAYPAIMDYFKNEIL